MDVRRLARTSVHTVEVNSTFYRLARREAVAGWIEQTPAGFLFAVKASRYLTHIKRLADIREGIARFYEPLEPMVAAKRLGPALRAHGVALTTGDHPARPFQPHEATADWRFVRFHYGSRGRGGNYSVTEIKSAYKSA